MSTSYPESNVVDSIPGYNIIVYRVAYKIRLPPVPHLVNINALMHPDINPRISLRPFIVYLFDRIVNGLTQQRFAEDRISLIKSLPSHVHPVYIEAFMRMDLRSHRITIRRILHK